MPLRQLVMLSPYRMPTHHPLMLGEDDAAAWLAAYRALWHPSLLRSAEGLPEIVDPHDHAEPQAGCLYAVPASPPAYLPENWDELVRFAGAAVIRGSATAEETNAELCRALDSLGVDYDTEVPTETMHRFAGLGLGYIVVETLFEAMEHEKLLDVPAFANEIKSAAALGSDSADTLQLAADRLLAARETLYPVTIHLLDLAFAGVGPLPMSLHRGSPLNLIATASAIEQLPADDRDLIYRRHDEGKLELCGGPLIERADALLPIESQLWNLRRGQERLREALGQPATVFGRATSAYHPYLPLVLQQVNLSKLWYVAFDGARVPPQTATSIRWPSPDGRQVDAFTRAPHPASDPQTFFHLSHYLQQTIAQDSTATLVLRHGERPAGLWYEDLLALSELAPVLGTWTLVGTYLESGMIGEYASAAEPDDFAPEDLDAAVNAARPDPVSCFARHARFRRRIDAAHTYLALLRSIGAPVDEVLLTWLSEAEDEMETEIGIEPTALDEVELAAAEPLATRLLSRATNGGPGLLVLNPCAFVRRVGLERTDLPGPPPIGGPVKAAQQDGEVVRVVVELPGLGFAWVPAVASPQMRAKLVLADGTTVRNEFFEAEVDPVTGGLRGFRDPRDRINRLGQQLIWQPGCTMKANEVRVTASGPALGEVTSTGELLDEHGGRLARFTQRFRAWLGRPLLELRIELRPEQPPAGYPWHAYFGSRFAWRDERATLVRGLFGQSSITAQQRPASPDFLELRSARSSVLIATGGLPYHQRHGVRMVDTILVVTGERASKFELALGLDRPQPALSAQGMVSPAAVVAAPNGPPHIGPTGWLAHLDSANLVMTSLRPEGATPSVLARLFEVSGFGGSAGIRWARNPVAAELVDGDGSTIMDAAIDGDGVTIDVTPHDLVTLRVRWS